MGVLVIDDSVDDVFFLERAIKTSKRFSLVGVAHDGVDAVSYLAGLGFYEDRGTHPYPDVVFLDLKMPRKDGFDVLAWINQQPTRPKVVVFTSSAEPQDRERAQELAADAFIVKPITIDQWDQVISSLDTSLNERSGFGSGSAGSASRS